MTDAREATGTGRFGKVRRLSPDRAAPHGRIVVAGHYEVDLDNPLGVGGMAIVYRGRDLRTRREVALKTVRPELAEDEQQRAQFKREARTMAFLSHANVVRVYDLWDGEDGPWAVLELIEGPSLKEAIRRDGPLTPERTGHFLGQIAAALDHLHRRGQVHLDVKPQNLVFPDRDTVKLIDFGIAQPRGQRQERVGGRAFGTAAYLSPEQALGEVVDVESDVYSLGCVVFEMLTGRSPFGEDDAPARGLIDAHLGLEPPALRMVAPALGELPSVEAVVARALGKDPADRFPDCSSFASAFRQAIDADRPPDRAVVTRELPAFHRAQRTVWIEPPDRERPYLVSAPPARRAAVSRVRTRFLWKLVAILAVANLLLAALSMWQFGTVPGLVDGPVAIASGARVTATERVNLRDAPGLDAGVLGEVDGGTAMDVTGGATRRDGQVWWPVAYDRDGFTVRAYAAADYLSAVRPTGRDRVAEWLDSLASG